MKFPTIKEMAEEVAEKALDEIEYNGKTIRQWVEIILATDNNVGTKLGTNLAEVGTDLISRAETIDALKEHRALYCDNTTDTFSKLSYAEKSRVDELDTAIATLVNLPPIQPKRGRWHYSDGKPARIGLSFGVVCDQCGTESEYCTNFCGECGADMRKKEVNNESN